MLKVNNTNAIKNDVVLVSYFIPFSSDYVVCFEQIKLMFGGKLQDCVYLTDLFQTFTVLLATHLQQVSHILRASQAFSSLKPVFHTLFVKSLFSRISLLFSYSRSFLAYTNTVLKQLCASFITLYSSFYRSKLQKNSAGSDLAIRISVYQQMKQLIKICKLK